MSTPCTHKKSPYDPHPLCCRCATKADIKECSPSSTCSFCYNLPQDSWTRILRCRQKRISRGIARLRATRPNPVSPPKLLFQDSQMDSATQLDEVAQDELSLLQRLELSQTTPSQLVVDEVYSQSDDDQEEGLEEEPQEEDSDSDSSGDESVGHVPPSGRASVVNAELIDAEEAIVTECPHVHTYWTSPVVRWGQRRSVVRHQAVPWRRDRKSGCAQPRLLKFRT